MNTRSKRKFCAIWFMLIMIILLSVPVGAEEKQSELICEVLDHDDAYLSEFMITKIIDGTESFDTSNDPDSPYYKDRIGNDENSSNRKVRTFDSITYNLGYRTAVNGENYYEKGAIEFEFLLPLKETEAVWDTDGMSWMDYGWSMETEDRTYDFDGDGRKETRSCQVLKGRKTLIKTLTNPTAIPGRGTLMAAVKVRAMKNEDVVSPVLTAWMEHNRSESTELGEKAVHPTEMDGICEEHSRREQITVRAEEVEVTAQPRYNVQIKQGNDAYNQVVGGTYDFDAGNDKALDKGKGKVTGTTTAYGVTLQLYNDKGKDLKGIELPSGPITFDLELSTTFVPSKGKLTETQKEYIAKNYAPLVLSWGPIANTNTVADERKLGDNLPYVIRGGPENASKNWNQGGNKCCNNGGVWTAVKNENTISVTIGDYEIDTGKFPNTDLGQATATNIYFDYKKGVENIGCFSAGMFFILTPSYNNGTTDPERKDLQILEDIQVEDGTFQTIIKDVKLRARTVSGQELDHVEDVSNQTGPKIDETNRIYGDDSITSTVYLSRRGNKSCRNQYSMADDCGGEKEADPLGRRYAARDGNWGNGKDALVRGHACAIMNGLMNVENGDMNNRVYAANVLTKFDAEAIELTGKYSLGSGVKKAGFKAAVLYAAKKDGTNWANDKEMVNARMEELCYFGSLTELKNAGYRCIGFMTEYRPPDNDYTKIKKVQQGGVLYSQVEGSVSASAVPGNVYQTVVAVKGWCGRDYIQNDEKKEIPSMLGNNPENAVQLPEATYTEYYPYEKARYNEYGYAGGHTGSYNYGDSLFILDTMSGITKRVEQMENGSTKSIYHVSDGQRYVDYVLTPQLKNESGDQSVSTTITITDVLPEKLSYVPESAYLGGTYIQNEESGQSGSVIGGTRAEPEARKNEDGTVFLIWRLQDVNTNDPLPQIHYSAQIGTPGDNERDVQNNEDILNIARIKSTGDLREYEETAGNESKTGIRISKLERSSPSKIPDQRFHDVTDSVGYTINVGNNSSTDMEKQLIMDLMPMDNDSKGNHFSGTVKMKELRIDPDKLGNMQEWCCYYTESLEVKDTLAKDYSYEDILTKQTSDINGTVIQWKKADVKDDGTITDMNEKTPTAIVWIGELKGEKTLSVQYKIKVEGAKGGDVIVNCVAYGKDETAKPKVYFVDRKISGLAWLDENEDGQRQADEIILEGIKVYLLKKNQNGTYKYVLDDDGRKVCVETTKDGYTFDDLPAGEYGIRFASGSATVDKFVPTKENVGDDTTDSDGVEIKNILLPKSKDMLVTHYESLYNDVGFYYKKGKITIKKTNHAGKGLEKVKFELEQRIDDGTWKRMEKEAVTNEEGVAVIEDISYGRYRLTEKQTTKGNSLLKEPVDIEMPYVSEEKGDREPSYIENGKYYYLELSYQIKNDRCFLLPESGGTGNRKWYLTGGVCLLLAIAWEIKRNMRNKM